MGGGGTPTSQAPRAPSAVCGDVNRASLIQELWERPLLGTPLLAASFVEESTSRCFGVSTWKEETPRACEREGPGILGGVSRHHSQLLGGPHRLRAFRGHRCPWATPRPGSSAPPYSPHRAGASPPQLGPALPRIPPLKPPTVTIPSTHSRACCSTGLSPGLLSTSAGNMTHPVTPELPASPKALLSPGRSATFGPPPLPPACPSPHAALPSTSFLLSS